MTDHMARGREFERLSQFDEALEAYSAEVRHGTRKFECLIARSDLQVRLGRVDLALSDIMNAVQINPINADAWFKKGNLEVSHSKPLDGIESLRKALALEPGSIPTMFALGCAFHVAGQHQEAVNIYQAILHRDSNHSAACSNLATILIAHGLYSQAKDFSSRALLSSPRFSNALFNLALSHDALGEAAEADNAYRKLLDIEPDHERACVNLGTLLGRKGLHQDALEFFQKAIKISPRWILPKVNASLTLRELGHESHANDILAEVLAKEPRLILASVTYAVSALPAVLGSIEEVDRARAAFKRRLVGIRQSLTSTTPSEIETAIGAIQPYYLAYQDRTNVELLKEYGEVVVDALACFQPKVQRHPERMSRKIMVGIVTAHARKHSVWDAITKGIVKQLDRSKFVVVLFSLDQRDPRPPELQMNQGDAFVSGHSSLSQWISAISEQSPDVLIYPEVGMNHRVLQLAALRLAPRQYAMWGHPETTGLSTIDGYFSGAAYEPYHADRYYVEKLIRLPGTASFYEPVATVSNSKSDVAASSTGRPRIVCPSAAFKFQPENDQVFVDIVLANPTTELIFFHMTKRWISERFEERLRKVFSDLDVDFDSHVKFEDWMSPNDFHQYLAGSTVVIDTIGFSGYNTAIQVLEVGTPFVAYESQFMRGRLGAGVLRTIDMDDFVADSRERFVTIVSDLIQNPSLLQTTRSRIAENRHKLFEDQSVIAGIERELLTPSVPSRS